MNLTQQGSAGPRDAISVVESVNVRPVMVPLEPPLRTASGVMASAPLALVDVVTAHGVAGHAYVFAYNPILLPALARLLDDVSKLLPGQPLAPRALMRKLRSRFVLPGTAGLLDMALAGLDMALWDAHARVAGQPLVRLLGGEPAAVTAYASFGMDGRERAVEAASRSVDAGFRAIKIKIGYPTLNEDLDVVRSVRAAIGPDVELMVDYNQALGVSDAIRRGHALDGEGLAWIEEPTLCDDLDGHAQIAAALKTPLQLGENSWGPRGIRTMISRHASDLAMPDLMKVGGIGGWLDAVAVCEANGVPVSNHFYQEMSAHLLALTPAAHYLEYFGLADAVLDNPSIVVDGCVTPSEEPGGGVTWNEAAVARFVL
ncbi:mandelate racemase [Paraburkholderia caballeronis]|nr:enolase C-terminal domain-like protein [Paraburkholderia caballeronis]TDV15800.1 mandelate racemase [Paraburkholderia caballeronis]TDV18055.1 mandelate racemase [Paraburkholderia caballeronis]TDV26331.1 mandelate racemase [Paraburkholderia caballeronis]